MRLFAVAQLAVVPVLAPPPEEGTERSRLRKPAPRQLSVHPADRDRPVAAVPVAGGQPNVYLLVEAMLLDKPANGAYRKPIGVVEADHAAGGEHLVGVEEVE